jgi:hypothetical protein
VAGIIPIPKYSEIVTALSVWVSFLIKIKQTDHRNEEKMINIAPNSIDMSGLITIIVPMKPIMRALVLRILIFSPIKITARIVAKIGTVKPRVVNCASGVEVIP